MKGSMRRKTLLISALTLGALLLAPVGVFAEGAAGSGGTGSGGTGGSSKYTQFKGKNGVAWSKFNKWATRVHSNLVNYAIVTNKDVKPLYGETPQEMIKNCKKSEVIWAYGTSQWYTKIGGSVPPVFKGTVTSADWNAMLPLNTSDSALNKRNKNLRAKFKSGNSGIVLLCSASNNVKNKDLVRTREKTEKKKVKSGGLTVSGISYSGSTFTPLVREEYNEYTKDERADWKASREKQVTGYLKTPFGDWLSSAGSKASKIIQARAKLKAHVDKGPFLEPTAGVEDADELARIAKENSNRIAAFNKETATLEKDVSDAEADFISSGTSAANTKAPERSIELSEVNQKGVRKGTVYNLKYYEKEGSATVGGGTVTYERKVTWQERSTDNGKTWTPIGGSTKEGKYYMTESEAATGKDAFSVEMASDPILVSQRQLISVTCNMAAFDTHVAKVPGIKVDKRTEYFSLAQTKKYKADDTLPFGYTNPTNTDEFFKGLDDCTDPGDGDPEKPHGIIDCITDPANADGSSDARNNVQNKGTKYKSTYGAQSKNAEMKTISSDTFSFFRNYSYMLDESNTVDNTVRVDIWYPKINVSNSGMTVNNSASGRTTYMTFDPEGTPTAEGVEAIINKGYSTSRLAEFSKPNRSLSTQEQSSVVTGQQIENDTVFTLPGEVNKVNMRANWSSDSTNPHRVGVLWDSPGTVTEWHYVSFGPGGGGALVPVIVPVKFGCEMRLNTTNRNRPLSTKDISTGNKPDEFQDGTNNSVKEYFVGSGSGLNNK